METITALIETLSSTQKEQSSSEHGCQFCGREVDEYFLLPDGRRFYCWTCRDCEKRVALEKLKRKQAEALLAEQRRLAGIQSRITEQIPPMYRDATLEKVPDVLRAELDARSAGQGLYLWGPTGCGKTYTMAALAIDRMKQGQKVVRLTFEKLIANLRKAHGEDYGAADRLAERYISCDLLIIEDIGLARVEGDFAYRRLYRILDERTENYQPVYFTANVPPTALKGSFDERIYSRIAGFCRVVKVAGADKRQAAQQSGPAL